MGTEIVARCRPALPPQPVLFSAGAITGYDANDAPRLEFKILGGKLDPTHSLGVNEPSFRKLAVIRAS